MKVKTNFRKMYLIDETMMNSKLSYQNMSLRPKSEVTSSIHINHPPVSADSTFRKVPSKKRQERSELVQSRDKKARMDENGMLQGNHYSPTVNPGQTLIKQSEEPENMNNHTQNLPPSFIKEKPSEDWINQQVQQQRENQDTCIECKDKDVTYEPYEIMYPNRTSTEVDDRKIIENPTYTDVNSNQQSQQNWSFMNTHHQPQPLTSTLDKEPPAGILPLEHTSMEVDDKRIMVRPVIDNIQSSVSTSNPTSALYPTVNSNQEFQQNWSIMNTHHQPQPLTSTLDKEPPAGILPLEHTSMEVDDTRIMVRPVIDNIQSSVSASNPTVRLDYPTSALYPTQNNSPMHRSNVPSIEHGSNVPAQHLSTLSLQNVQPRQLMHVPSDSSSVQNRENRYPQQMVTFSSDKKPIMYEQPLSIQYDQNKSTPMYLQYQETPKIVKRPNVTISYTCTLCNLNFAKKEALLRHNKNIHDAFYQTEKGDKRKFMGTYSDPNKRLKKTPGGKRKLTYVTTEKPKRLQQLTKEQYESYNE